MSILGEIGIGSIVKSIGQIADDLITSDEERGNLDYKNRQLDQANDLAQIEVNKEQAKSSSLFVAGARPFIMWVCGFALAYHYIIQPMTIFILTVLKIQIPELPEFDMASLMTLMLSLLGLGGMRTYEKYKGVARKSINE